MPADKKLTYEFRDAGPQRSSFPHQGARAFDFPGRVSDPDAFALSRGFIGGAWAFLLSGHTAGVPPRRTAGTLWPRRRRVAATGRGLSLN